MQNKKLIEATCTAVQNQVARSLRSTPEREADPVKSDVIMVSKKEPAPESDSKGDVEAAPVSSNFNPVIVTATVHSEVEKDTQG